MTGYEPVFNGYVELQDHMGGDLSVVSAARTSFLHDTKGEEKDRNLLNYLFRHNEMAAFEMCVFRFRIQAPLFVRAQIVRYRTASSNEQSRRYTSAGIELFVPDAWRMQADTDKQASSGLLAAQDEAWNTARYAWGIALQAYAQLLALGVAREQARMVLPTALMTTFVWKIDLRNLLHFLDERTDETHAQHEIVQYAKAIARLIEPVVPWTMAAWKEKRGIAW